MTYKKVIGAVFLMFVAAIGVADHLEAYQHEVNIEIRISGGESSRLFFMAHHLAEIIELTASQAGKTFDTHVVAHNRNIDMSLRRNSTDLVLYLAYNEERFNFQEELLQRQSRDWPYAALNIVSRIASAPVLLHSSDIDLDGQLSTIIQRPPMFRSIKVYFGNAEAGILAGNPGSTLNDLIALGEIASSPSEADLAITIMTAEHLNNVQRNKKFYTIGVLPFMQHIDLLAVIDNGDNIDMGILTIIQEASKSESLIDWLSNHNFSPISRNREMTLWQYDVDNRPFHSMDEEDSCKVECPKVGTCPQSLLVESAVRCCGKVGACPQ